jgi:phosphoadenosine phosphosulfate reductase
MVAQIDASMPVLFINTEKLFPETIFYRDLLVQQLGLKDTREIRPDPATLAEHDPDGKLWKRNPDFCCLLRKTQPLDTALSGFSAWITGRKQIHGGARQSLAVIEAADGRIKINPLAHWSQDDLDSYAADHELPAHPLVEHGYQSVGCMPCTQPVLRGENPRDGRWRGTNKVECGIHLPRTRFDRPRENS